MNSVVRVFPNDVINQPAVRNTHRTIKVALPISKLMEWNSLARKPADGVFWRVSVKASRFIERAEAAARISPLPHSHWKMMPLLNVLVWNLIMTCISHLPKMEKLTKQIRRFLSLDK